EEVAGGELNLQEFTNLEKLKINLQLLKTPLTKLNINEELGISENKEKKALVKEIRKLIELFANQNNKQISIYFATEKAPQEKLENKNATWEEKEGVYTIYLQLEREYKKEFELLLNPATFPTEKLEIKEFLIIYYPSLEDIIDNQISQIVELVELISEELSKNPNEEELKRLVIKVTVNYNSEQSEYIIQVQYQSQNPRQEKLKEIITIIPLQAEIELLKEQKSQLPTPEKLIQLEQEKKQLEEQL
ncbi:4402_t:CDS:2, partial [Scutellospora calospora]